MIKALDGPAQGTSLAVSKAPPYLRFVRDRDTHKWDCLNLSEDTPSEHEEIFLYRLHPGSFSMVHIDYRGSKPSTWDASGNYSHIETPVEIRETFRDYNVYLKYLQQNFNDW